MYRLINLVVFIAFALLAESQVGSAEELFPQIKVTRVEVPYVNPKYSDLVTFKILKHNATYNMIHIDWHVLQNYPLDAVVNMELYVTNSKYQDEKLILQESVPLCKDSPKRHLLPIALTLPKSRLEGCVKKGNYPTDNAGNFRFELAVPNIHEISDYHYTRFVLANKDETIAIVKFFSEWGYLNDSTL